MGNILDFGAVGDFNGTAGTDNTAAINATLAASGSIEVPEGEFYCAGPLTVSDKPVFIRGAGPKCSQIVFAAGVGTGLTVSQNVGSNPVGIVDLTLATLADPVSVQDRALAISWPINWDNRFYGKGSMQNVEFRGYNPLLYGWNKGVTFTQGLIFYMEYCNFLGKIENGWGNFTHASITRSDTAIEWLGGWFPTDFTLVGVNWIGWKNAFVGGGAAEGMTFLKCAAGYCDFGVKWFTGLYDPALWPFLGQNAAGRPMLNISDSHFSTYKSAIQTDGVVSIGINNNLIYYANDDVQGTNLIELRHGGDARVAGNILWGFKPGANAIVIGDSGQGFGDAIVESNQLGGTFGTGIWFRADAHDCIERLNKFNKATYTAGVGRVYNQGSNNYVTGRWGTPTGTTSRLAFATASVSTSQLAQRVAALINDLKSGGVI